MDQSENSPEHETKDILLKNVKKEVKQIMEEAVTRKFIHEESSSVISLCGAVESCLQHGLKKRALGLFKNSTTTMALLQKIAKNFEPALRLLRILNELERGQEQTRRSTEGTAPSSTSSSANVGQHHYHHLVKRGSSKYLWIRIALYEKQLARIVDHLVKNNSKYYEKEALISDAVCGAILASLLVGPCALEFTQMKTVDHLWTDPPAKELMQRHRIHSTAGHHHLPGTHSDSPKRLALQVHKTSSSTSEECQRNIPFLAKEYVESLHQNSKTTLLYGKNNVVIQPKEDVESMAGYLSLHQNQCSLVVKWTPNQLMNVASEEAAAAEGGGGGGGIQPDRRPIYVKYSQSQKSLLNGKQSQYWNYALAIHLDDIVYLHCHQQPESGGTVVLVGQDGVQRPPIRFPKGGHLWAFLACIENGLSPGGRLEPPLSTRKGEGEEEEDAGEIFPALLKKKIGGASNVLSSLLGSMTDELTSAFNQSQASVQESTPQKIGSPNHQQADRKLAKSSSAKGSSADLFQNGVGGGGDITPHGNETVASDYVFRIVIENRNSCFVSDSILEYDEKTCGEAAPTDTGAPTAPHDPPGFSDPMGTPSDVVSSSQADSSLAAHRTAVRQLCSTMSSQILSRAFYGWLSHCRQLKTVRTHLSGLVHPGRCGLDVVPEARNGLTADRWSELTGSGRVEDEAALHERVYHGGCQHELRREVWPFLLGHYGANSDPEEREAIDEAVRSDYRDKMAEWSRVEEAIKSQERERLQTVSNAPSDANLAPSSASSRNVNNGNNKPRKEPPSSSEGDGGLGGCTPLARKESSLSSDVFESVETCDEAVSTTTTTLVQTDSRSTLQTSVATRTDPSTPITGASATPSSSSLSSILSSLSSSSMPLRGVASGSFQSSAATSASCQVGRHSHARRMLEKKNKGSTRATFTLSDDTSLESSDSLKLDSVDSDSMSTWNNNNNNNNGNKDENHTTAARKEEGGPIGVPYSTQLLENFGLNIQRIDKDVHRCDRNHPYFALQSNLNKLRNIMCTYVWNNMDMGYVQGMCDLAAPLLVVLDDEPLVYSCFTQNMKRMSANFPNGNAMDQHFGNMRSLIQIMDPELFEHMKQYGDYTHFYFCYRWFLLDFKRELVYSDIFKVWETIWSSRKVCSPHFVLFIALALLEYYREVVMDNRMDFTEIIKFFNELAEKHNATEILNIARSLVGRLQELIENK